MSDLCPCHWSGCGCDQVPVAEAAQLRVSEVFYSLQGEGRRAGEPSLFVRLQGCSAQHACASSGVSCDTEFESGRAMTTATLLADLQRRSAACRWIVWTGGEPTDQLTPDVVAFFKAHGYRQAIETSGVRAVPDGIDWVTVSPKVAEHVLARHFVAVDELKYVRHAGQAIPQPSIRASHYYLLPHASGDRLDPESVAACMQLALENPSWSLALQTHKLLGVR